jgi:hypothetical protein
MQWNDWEAKGMTEEDLHKLEGREVCSADNQMIGKIDLVWSPMDNVEATTFRVKTDDRDLWVPLFAVSNIDKDRIVVEASRDEIQKQEQWTEEPPGYVPSVDKHGENWIG